MRYLRWYIILFAVLAYSSAYASAPGRSLTEGAGSPSPPPGKTSDTGGSKSRNNNAQAPAPHSYPLFNIDGAESLGVKSGNIVQMNLLMDDGLTKVPVGTFMEILVERRFSGGDAEQALERLFSHIPGTYNKDKTPLNPPVYFRFGNKQADGKQFITLAQNVNRLNAEQSYSMSAVFKITDTQWGDGKNAPLLTVFMKPAVSQ